MRIIDISREMLAAPLYPGTPQPQLTPLLRMEDGAEYNLSQITAGMHFAPHANAALHFFPEGADIAAMPLENYIGPCRVMELDQPAADRSWLESRLPVGVKRLLLKAGGKAVLTVDGAEYLAERGLLLVGVDSLSIGIPLEEGPVHLPILAAGMAVLEQLELSAVAEGEYFLSAAPIKIAGSEASWCRAVLLAQD